MEGKCPISPGILLVFMICLALMPLCIARQPAGYEESRGTAGPGTTVESIIDQPGFTIDPAFIQATPHWILIIAGKKEQDALIGYIMNTTVPPRKKVAWEAALRRIWAAYPVKVVPSAGGTTLITCDCDLSTLKISPADDETLREIEREIALAMERSLVETVTPAG